MLKKPFAMGWANPPQGDLAWLEPLPEVRHDSAIQANRTAGITLAAKIAGEGLRNYVNLVARARITSAGVATYLLVHSET
jgi:hypothetical protein